MDKIISKRYYKIVFRLASALSVGDGSNDNSDKDIVRDGIGRPYIPGSSLAGVYRSFFEKETAEQYFGYMNINTGDNYSDTCSSKVKVYDATLLSEEYRVSKRDCVALDEWKTAKAGAKFDFEILEPGVEFVTYIEQDKYDGDENIGDSIAKLWEEKLVSFGGNLGRGLGKVCDVRIFVLEFSFEAAKNDIEKWLEFDMYKDESWTSAISFDKLSAPYIKGLKKSGTVISLKLRQRSPIIIKVYTTDVSTLKTMPDYKQMTYTRRIAGKDVEIPVIPGTTWAGAFRHRMLELGGDSIDKFFGEKSVQKSLIRFSESEIEGAKSKEAMHNAIDRFSGGAADKVLFGEKKYVGGKTTLDIELLKYDETLIKALAAAITDLHFGFMSIGGDTSIGHGLFEVEEVHCAGSVFKPEGDSLYEELVRLLSGAESEAI